MMYCHDKVEWVIEPFKGWAIEYAVVTAPDGARYTPIDREFYIHHHMSDN